MTSLYIHIPFCRQKCNYCDFVSFAGQEHLIDEYVKVLCQEIKQLPTSNSELQTIFFGGGTPTLLEPKHFEKILFLVACHSEISIEANPATADKAKLRALRELGINRLSIGAQSFNNQHLNVLGRIHNQAEIFRIYDDARSAGFDNINLDLIFALPDQTFSEWQSDLKTAISMGPEHLSCYCLEGKMSQNNEDTELAMFELTIETLTNNGFKHYEISNFAKPGRECQHNIVYWKNENYIGVGAGAHSHVDGQRWANPDSIEEYLRSVTVTRPVSSDGYGKETIFMGLRMLEGLSIEKFKDFEKEVKELIENGLLTREKDNYKLTRRGLYLANEVFQKFV